MATAYRPLEAIQLLRPAFRSLRLRPSSRIPQAAFSTYRRAQASQSPSTPGSSPPPPPTKHQHRQVTIANDTGAVKWTDLSPGEKAARTTQQSFNFVVIIAGVVLTGAVAYFVFSDIVSPNSKTFHFNKATSRIRESPECVRLLGGSGHEIQAYGEASWSRWARNRFISSSKETDQWGTEHLRIRFYVEGPANQGVVHVHLTKRPSQHEFEYATLAVDVKGHNRVYLENADERSGSKVAPKIFGARWW